MLRLGASNGATRGDAPSDSASPLTGEPKPRAGAEAAAQSSAWPCGGGEHGGGPGAASSPWLSPLPSTRVAGTLDAAWARSASTSARRALIVTSYCIRSCARASAPASRCKARASAASRRACTESRRCSYCAAAAASATDVARQASTSAVRADPWSGECGECVAQSCDSRARRSASAASARDRSDAVAACASLARDRSVADSASADSRRACREATSAMDAVRAARASSSCSSRRGDSRPTPAPRIRECTRRVNKDPGVTIFVCHVGWEPASDGCPWVLRGGVCG